MFLNNVYNKDCMEGMKEMPENSVDFTLTDIPYDFFKNLYTAQSRKKSKRGFGIRKIDKGIADKITFELKEFLENLLRITKGSICIFCGYEQFSEIYSFFISLKDGTVRPIVWNKDNPSPLNAKYVYLNGTEFAVWYRPPRAVFNSFCKKNVFSYPQGSSKDFPTQKNLKMFADLITDNSAPRDIIFDPCMGSGTTAIAALSCNRRFLGFEIDKKAYELIYKRLSNNIIYSSLFKKDEVL